MTFENGSISVQNDSMTPVSASPTSRACDATSASNSVLPTTDSVRRFISCAMSTSSPSVHDPRCRSAYSTIVAAYFATRSR